MGFAAETNNVLNFAKEKLIKKNCNMIIANDVSNKKIGFQSDQNQVALLTNDGEIKKIPLSSKTVLAQKIVKQIILNHHSKTIV